MKLKYTIAALAATTLAVNAAQVITSNGTVSGADDANHAGPMWGQQITVNVGADTADGSITPTVFIEELSYQYSSSASGGVPGDFMQVYSDFVTDGAGAITSIGTLIAVSNDANFGVLAGGDQLTWTFGGDALDAISKSTQYMFVSASDAVAATLLSNGNLIGGGYELATTNPYAGGDSLRGNGGNTGWDQDFELKTNTVAVPEPSSTALLGLAGLALILRRRK
tara:strand:- start:558 stop:1229 length:672 start_codon:yes stop_codon:yes gene_type:complete